MKIFKLFLPFILLASLSIPAFAEHLPEDYIIDRELIVEEDRSVIKDMLDADKGRAPSDPVGRVQTVRMSRVMYFKCVLLPFLTLFVIGLLAFSLSVGVRFLKGKSNKKAPF